MKVLNNNQENFLFFLQLSEKLPEEFIHLSYQLSQYSINLIPIKFKDLKEIKMESGNKMLVLTKNLATRDLFLKMRVRILDFYLKNKNIQIFHLSSFGHLGPTDTSKVKDYYTYYQLPCKMSDIVSLLVIKVFKDKKTLYKWPGGKRAKLPTSQ